MKSVPVIWNGKKLRDVYPHASKWQVFKWKVGKFFRKVIIVFIVVVLVNIIYFTIAEFNKAKYQVSETPVVQKTTDNELERIMNDADFKAITILRARKVASDSKMKKENEKHESIINEEKTRHDSILAQIEAENEAIRAEELALVGSANLK